MTIEQEVQTLRITKCEQIAATPEVVWEALIYNMGPGTEFSPGQPMPMRLEAFPGGRWWRETGEDAGHLWGHVQVIKPNKVLELCGPMFMSYAAQSHIQYKLSPDGAGTRLDFVHTAIGLIPPDIASGFKGGWGEQLKRIRERAGRPTR